MKKILLKTIGKVKTGVGDFSKRMETIPGLLDLYYKKTGMKFYPGTLNIKLEKDFSLPTNCLRIEGDDYGGPVSINILPCKIDGIPAFLLRTDNNEKGLNETHPKSLIEIACNYKLRNRLNLEDNDQVTIELFEINEIES
jgi:riboflavin kinase